MTDSEKKNPSAFDERLRLGRPLMECVIETPYNLVISETGVQVDAPCLQFNHTDALGVLRVTFTPLAARQLRDALNQIEFADIRGFGTDIMQ